MIAVEAPSWRGAGDGDILAGMELNRNDASRGGSAAKAIDLPFARPNG